MTARCDTCGKPYVENDMLYSIASKFDDDGELVSFRHWHCHVPVDKAIANLRDAITRVERQIKDL